MTHIPDERAMAPLGTQSPADDHFSIGELLNILRRRKRVILFTVVLLTVLATVIGLRIMPVYTAIATVTIEPREDRVVGVEQVPAGLPADNATLQTQAEIIRSRELMAQTMEELGLFNDPEFAVSPAPTDLAPEWPPWTWLARMGLAQETGGTGVEPGERASSEAIRETAIDVFAANLYVRPSGGSHVLWIEYSSPDPVKAAAIANKLAKAYVDGQVAQKQKAIKRSNRWLSERLRILQQEVQEAEQDITRFRNENQLVTAKGIILSETQLAALHQALIELQAQKAEREAKLQLIRDLKASGKDPDSISEVVASRLVSDLRRQDAELGSRQAELATTYGERHPQMQALREERARLTAAIRGEMERITRSLENELTAITTRESNLKQAVQVAKSQSALEGQAEVRLAELERVAAAKRTLYEALLTRYQQTKAQEGLLQPDARIISPAGISPTPSTPSPKIFAAVGFTMSAVFGCMLALLVEQLDKSLRSSKQIERILQVPCLGLVPSVGGLRRNQTLHGHLCAKPRSAYAQAISALYTHLLVTGSDPLANRVVLVTSSLPGEGKTTLAASLAVFAAQIRGRKTLLVDLDLWRPAVAHEFRLRPASGAAEVVAGDQGLEQALVTDEATGIDILPASWRPSNVTTFLTSPRMHTLLRKLRERYDCIIIDSPPLLGVADAEILSSYADATIFVVRWERTKQDAAANGLKFLRLASANVVGAVLTQVNLKKHSRYRYGDGVQYYQSYRKYYVD